MAAPTVSVVLKLSDLGGASLAPTPVVRLRPHTPFAISGTDLSHWMIASGWKEVSIATPDSQAIPLVPTVGGTIGLVTYTVAPETVYDVQIIGATGQGAFYCQIRVPCSNAAVTWASCLVTS